jgi:hypothetical protein
MFPLLPAARRRQARRATRGQLAPDISAAVAGRSTVVGVRLGHRRSAVLQAVGVAALLCVLLRPLLHDVAVRGADFWVHYWYVWHQGESLKHGGPSLFLHDPASVFVPRFAFYGGTLYTVTGALGLLVGSAYRAYVATYLLAGATAYGGWWWLGRQAGLGRIAAHAPAIAFTTSAYAITLPVTRGDWPEYVSVSMIPLLAASTVSVLRADRLRLWPVLALMVSSVLFTGSHNLSLLYGTTFLVALAVLLVVCVPQARRLVTRRGALRVAAILVPAVLVNAWFLVPDIVYQAHTATGNQGPRWQAYLEHYTYLVRGPRIFTLQRDAGDPVVLDYGAFALPVLAMAWTVAAALTGRPRLRGPWLRTLVVLGVAATAVILAMVHVDVLRGPYKMLQFSMRLESYVNLAVSGAVLAALVLVKDRPASVRRACWAALAAILALSVVQGAGQAGHHRDTTGNTDIAKSPSYDEPTGMTHVEDYSSGDLDIVSAPDLPPLAFPAGRIRDGSVSVRLAASAGQLFATNLVTVPQLIHLEGAHAVALNTGMRLIVEIDPQPGPGLARVTVSEARPPAVVAGRWLTLLGLLGLAANLAAIARRRWWRRRPPAERVVAQERPVAVLR